MKIKVMIAICTKQKYFFFQKYFQMSQKFVVSIWRNKNSLRMVRQIPVYV